MNRTQPTPEVLTDAVPRGQAAFAKPFHRVESVCEFCREVPVGRECTAVREGYFCTRAKYHQGEHVACGRGHGARVWAKQRRVGSSVAP